VVFKTGIRALRLDQLTDEMRALPGLAGIRGLSASGPSPAGDIEITVHTGDVALSAEEERAVADAIARHVPDPQWGLSDERKELAAVLARSEGSLSVRDLEKALRLLARTLERQSPDAVAATPATYGSDRE
jgi:hypothetical protein